LDLGLAGKVALVTGASAGIGFAVAGELAREGVRVVIASREEKRIQDAAARIRAETNGEVVALVADVSEPAAPTRLVSETLALAGALHILVANAGGPPGGNFADVGEDDFSRAIELTFRSVERLVRAAVPPMRAAKWGRIVSLTSIAAKEPHDGLLLSNSLRPAVHGFSKSLSRELARDGITVNCICTGFTDTERLHDLARAAAKRRGVSVEAVFSGWRSAVPRASLGRPEEIAAAVTFLCSERASYVNGVSLAVDGGEAHSLL
jgi:3-oxoacyl-[acyl-carrier protein] reductase